MFYVVKWCFLSVIENSFILCESFFWVNIGICWVNKNIFGCVFLIIMVEILVNLYLYVMCLIVDFC